MNYKNNSLTAFIAATLLTSTLVQAGPPVTITVKNLSNQKAIFQADSTNSVQTKAHAQPEPSAAVDALQSNSYTVQNPAFPDITTASMRYTIGNKTCNFTTSYLNTIAPGGLFTGTTNQAPKWNKKAIGSGGATCTATITSTNFSNHSWHITFTMK